MHKAKCFPVAGIHVEYIATVLKIDGIPLENRWDPLNILSISIM